MNATNRIYTDVETKQSFRLWMDSEKHHFSLIHDGNEKYAKGTEVNGFYLCPFDAVTVKIEDSIKYESKTVSLGMGEFYNLKEGENVTHKKFAGFKRFRKV